MNKHRRDRRGMSSVLAMIYLLIMAAMAVGFYSAIDAGTSISDNQQYVQRASSAAEASLAFTRYQLSQVILPFGTTQAQVMGLVFTQLGTALNGTANMGGHNPTQSGGNTGPISIPGQTNGATNWMSTDSQGGQAYVTVSQIPGTMDLRVLSVASNTNSQATSISRKQQVNFGHGNGINPLFNYGIISYGALSLNSSVNVSGNNGGVFVATAGLPISVNARSSFSGNFAYTNTTPVNSISWGGANGLSVDGYNSGQAQFSSHVFPSSPSPVLPTIDTSAFPQFCVPLYGGTTLTAGTYNPNATTLTNTILSPGTYIFNNPITVNGILYLGSTPTTGVNLTFNSSATINGCIVQQNTTNATSYNLVFNNVTTGNPITNLSGPHFPANETALSGSFLLLPTYKVTINNTLTAAGSMIASRFLFNNQTNLTLTNGSLLSLGVNQPMTFNNTANISVTTTHVMPAGVSGGSSVIYNAVPSSYTEVYP